MAIQSSKKLATDLDLALGESRASIAIADVIICTICHYIPAPDQTVKLLQKFARDVLTITNSASYLMLSALTYIDRYFEAKERLSQEAAQSHNEHLSLLLCSFVLAHKYGLDVKVFNSSWLEVASPFFTTDAINRMEREFLCIINFNVKVEDQDTQERWLEAIQALTEDVDPELIVKISSQDALSMDPAVSLHSSLSRKTAPSTRTSSTRTSTARPSLGERSPHFGTTSSRQTSSTPQTLDRKFSRKSTLSHEVDKINFAKMNTDATTTGNMGRSKRNSVQPRPASWCEPGMVRVSETVDSSVRSQTLPREVETSSVFSWGKLKAIFKKPGTPT
ncbi:hypothetical protein CcCBS67573_g10676 [Chytriomyces confervae]|uniref:Laminin IV type B domain-containing protein n=1 Tax=Chytriomyces confervae TaxID=246404 RepID=A0A507CE66_9FUNG|nr:hypothetical protein CcCBS67573_g10676 [Chytriomyces confervae]